MRSSSLAGRLTSAFTALAVVAAPVPAAAAPRGVDWEEIEFQLNDAELAEFLKDYPRDENGNLQEPSPESMPLTEINRAFERDAIALLQEWGVTEKIDCLNPFPDRLITRFQHFGLTLDNFSEREQQCAEVIGGSGTPDSALLPELHYLTGGIPEDMRAELHHLADKLGYTINDDTLDLHVAAHEWKHERDRHLQKPSTEGSADIFAALVLQARNAPDARGVILLMDYYRYQGPAGVHQRSYVSPLADGVPNDLTFLATAADIFHTVRKPKSFPVSPAP